MYFNLETKKKWRKKQMNRDAGEYPDKKQVFCALCVLGGILGGVLIIIVSIIKGG
jgi:hypothetical protein